MTRTNRSVDQSVSLPSFVEHAARARSVDMCHTIGQPKTSMCMARPFACTHNTLKTQISTSGGVLCFFGSHTSMPKSWMCKKQTSVSHSSTEVEIISLDAVLLMDGIPALTLWDLVIEMFHSVPNKIEQPKEELLRNRSADVKPNMHNPIPIKNTNVIPTNIDRIPSNTMHSGSSAMLYVFEDNEAVIKMIVNGRSPTMTHVSRTRRVAPDRLFDRINLDPKIQMEYIDTKHQLADMLTMFLYANVLRTLASARVPIFENETGCKAEDKCVFPHYKVDEPPKKKPKKHLPKKRKRRQECCRYCDECITIVLCITRFRYTRFSRKTVSVKQDAKKSWNKFKGNDSLSLRQDKRASGKRQDHRWEK